MCRLDGAALPRIRSPNVPVRGRVAARSADLPGGHLGLCNAPPVIIGARVPEAYVAIMEPISGYGNREFLSPF